MSMLAQYSPTWRRVAVTASMMLGVLIMACADSATITLDPSIRYQTMVGWETHHQSGRAHAQYLAFKDSLFDLAVNELGINRIRIEAWSGFEQRMDWYAESRSGRPFSQIKPYRFCTENDNADPNVINWAGFHFTLLDEAIETVVLPLRKRLEERGEKLYINLTYDSFIRQCPSIPYIHNQIPEYAEFALATFLHLRDKYNVVPDSWEMILEPDNSDWRGAAIGRALVATGDLLKQHGFTPAFVAPSTSALMNAVRYFDEMIEVPRVTEYLSEISYHRYGKPDPRWKRQLRDIGERGVRYRLRTAMLEHIGSGHDDLHEDLSLANVSAWQQFALAFPEKDNGAQYFLIGDDGQVRLGERSRYLRQYFRYVRAGYVRVRAATSSAQVAPLAFVAPNGGLVVVVKAHKSVKLRVQGLPSGRYGVSYTTRAETGKEAGDVTVGTDSVLNAAIPHRGVLTIYPR